MRPDSWAAAAKRPFVIAGKTFLPPWTGCDSNGEGYGERKSKKRRNVSDERF